MNDDFQIQDTGRRISRRIGALGVAFALVTLSCAPPVDAQLLRRRGGGSSGGGDGSGDPAAQCPSPAVTDIIEMGEDGRMEFFGQLEAGGLPAPGVYGGTPFLHDPEEFKAWYQDQFSDGALGSVADSGLLGALFGELPDPADQEAFTAFMQQLWIGKTVYTRFGRLLAKDRLVCDIPLIYHEVYPTEDSSFDGDPVIYIEIGRPNADNPIAACWDEVRQVDEGIYLGVNYCPLSDGSIAHLQTFVLDSNCPDPPEDVQLDICE